MINSFQRNRAKEKIAWIREVFPDLSNAASILDLGCAEGYLGEHCQNTFKADVSLADVVDMNKTKLDLDIYDGLTLPYGDSTFDTCLLVFVLHHTSDARRVLEEAARVSQNIVFIESVYKTNWDLRQLTFLDKMFNRIRSEGKMNAQEEHLYFRKSSEWMTLFDDLGFTVVSRSEKGRVFHQQSLFVLKTW